MPQQNEKDKKEKQHERTNEPMGKNIHIPVIHVKDKPALQNQNVFVETRRGNVVFEPGARSSQLAWRTAPEPSRASEEHLGTKHLAAAAMD